MRTRFAVLALFSVVALIGCSKAGTLTFTNNTGAPIWVKVGTDTNKVEAAKSYVYSEKLDYLVVYAEKKIVDYDVYGYFKFTASKTAQIVAGDDTAVAVAADAGAVGISNDSSYTITVVKISPASITSWGDNLLSASTTFSPGKTLYWTVAPDVKYDAYIDSTNPGYYTQISGTAQRPSSIAKGKVWYIGIGNTAYTSSSTAQAFDPTFEVVPNTGSGPVIQMNQKSQGAGADYSIVK